MQETSDTAALELISTVQKLQSWLFMSLLPTPYQILPSLPLGKDTELMFPLSFFWASVKVLDQPGSRQVPLYLKDKFVINVWISKGPQYPINQQKSPTIV